MIHIYYFMSSQTTLFCHYGRRHLSRWVMIVQNVPYLDIFKSKISNIRKIVYFFLPMDGFDVIFKLLDIIFQDEIYNSFEINVLCSLFYTWIMKFYNALHLMCTHFFLGSIKIQIIFWWIQEKETIKSSLLLLKLPKIISRLVYI